jgi:hypothetical protein
MPKFLDSDEIYRIIQRELPENVYPDGLPSSRVMLSDNYAASKALSGSYARLEVAYNNMFPQLATEQLADFETKYFAFSSVGILTEEERRERILGKIRARPSISVWDILTVVNSFVPQGVFTQIVEWGNYENGETWILDVSLLDRSTYLGPAFGNRLGLTGEGACAVWGPDWQQGDTPPSNTFLTPAMDNQAAVLSVRELVYTYEVRLFGLSLSPEQLSQLDLQLSQIEPARSRHIIRQGLNLNDFDLTVDVNNVTQFSNENCIARDVLSNSGYIAKRKP